MNEHYTEHILNFKHILTHHIDNQDTLCEARGASLVHIKQANLPIACEGCPTSWGCLVDMMTQCDKLLKNDNNYSYIL